LMIANLTGIKWNLKAVFMFISLASKQAEHFFMYLMAICISSWKNMSFQVICPFIDWNISSFGINFHWILYIFWILILCQINSW
jgi:hypothetical protein